MAGGFALVLFFAPFLFLQYSAAQTVHTVGDSAGWRIHQNDAAFYANWAAGRTFQVGDSLVFNFTTDLDEVTRVSKRSFDLCRDDDEIGDSIETGPATIPLSSPGEYYFISPEDRHCQQGQKLAINVSAAAGPMAPPSSNPPPSNARPPSPRPAPVTHIVGDGVGWTIPPSGATFYVSWAAGKTFTVGDSLVFNFRTDVHDVERVPKGSFDICSDDQEIGDTIESGPATILLTAPGEHYYISTENQDCQFGQKLAINVTTTGSKGPVTSISSLPTSGPTTGSSPSTPGGTGPPNSSANTVAAALFATALGLVLSFF